MSKEKKFMTCDGNQAAAHISYMFTEVAAIYPITPSSTMAEHVDEWAAAGRKNIFGETVTVQEMQSEGGAAGAVHGSLQAGALTTTYTASQGLLLMIPNMYKIAGEMLPGVFHVSARTLASHTLCIFGDHQDVMATRQTGFAMLAEGSVQEVMDLAGVAHLSAIKAHIPFVNFFDGFRTSHEIQKVEAMDQEDLRPLIDMEELAKFRRNAMNPDKPVTRGTAENPDVFFQHRESCNEYYAAVPAIVEDYMNKISEITGRKYGLFDYYGAKDADRVIIAMGSVTEAIRETIDYLTEKGEKVGLVAVHLYRPFSAKHFLAAVPSTAKRIAVLDRTKEPGANGEPLYLDVKDCFYGTENAPIIVGGRYGLGSKDTTPAQILAVYENLALPMPKNQFTIGIEDDVTFASLPMKEEVAMGGAGMFQAKFYGLGADGTVGANKNSVKIIGDNTDKHCQAYFSYDSKKSGGFTCSHLRFGDEPIRSTYLVTTPNFVACHVQAYLHMYDVTRGLQKGGTFLLNTVWDADKLAENLPNNVKKYFADNNIKVYYINATKIAQEIGLGNRTNNILQAAFFALTKVIPLDTAVEDMKKNNYNSYFKKAGQRIVDLNDKAVELGVNAAEKVEIPASWATAPDDAQPEICATEFVKDIVIPCDRQKGNELPVSVFAKHGVLDGTWENGTSAYAKRGVAVNVPAWNADACIQCNRCAMACPHAAIRPVLLTVEEKKGVPESFVTVPAKGLGKDAPAYSFRMQVSPYDCLGCGVCLTVCPAKEKGALVMKPFEEMKNEQKNFDEVAMNEAYLKKDVISDKNVKSIQFSKPYFQFSAACAGCAETTYLKLLSQLVGDRMYAGNAAGCSSAYSGGAPILPYCKDAQGRGPAWEHSLFEDNAEFAYGFFHAQDSIRKELLLHVQALKDAGIAEKECKDYLNNWEDKEKTRAVTDALLAALEGCDNVDACYVKDNREYLSKKSVWAIGGDGWAYDIGFGGIDHVMAQNRDVNLLVLDTEVYSNTGGQSSKATNISATAKFSAGGKQVAKKDLGAILMTYGYVYVAQVAMGYDQAQTLKALREAESYPGPAIVIAYCPCLEHGIKAGMSTTQDEMKKAVECGYWHLYRYDPRRAAEGKNPFQLDSPEPDSTKIAAYLQGENRYASLKNNFPEYADDLYEKFYANAKARYAKYVKMAEE